MLLTLFNNLINFVLRFDINGEATGIGTVAI